MTLLTGAGFGTAPERTALKNKIEQELRILFGKYGYNEISLPVYEYYSILKDTDRFLDHHLISFTDVSSGRMLVLRPDFTPQVSRLVAGYKDTFPLPIRLSYGGPVFRNADIQHGAKAEKYHLGCELYGAPEKEGDKELLLLLTAAADKVKTDFTLLIGDAFYLARLSVLLGDRSAEYFDILKSKKLYKIKDFVASLSAGLSQDAASPLPLLLSKLPSIFGGVEAARELNALSVFDPELSKRSEYLISLFSDIISLGISADRLLFDPAEILDLNYYTGITFELFHRTSGTALGGGGRYDTLMRNFGLDLTACGFSLYLEETADASGFENERIKADYLVLGEKNLMKAEELRRAGYTVISVYDEKEASAFSTFADVKNIIK
jgi:ATP phosphoribosyltransferase regulatory subunit